MTDDAMTSEKKKFSFMKWRHLFLLLSFTIVGLSVFEWFTTGEEKFGVDFLGGAEVEVRFDEVVRIGQVRKALADAGLENAIVQEFHELGERTGEFSIRLKAADGADTPKRVREALTKIEGTSFEVLSQDYIGPTIGAEIRRSGLTAIGLAVLGMLIYISLRFEWRFACGAIWAIVHDVFVTVGIYILSGRELSAAVLAAVMTIVGYSVNDTIVLFDRVRENILKMRKKGGAAAAQGMKLEELLELFDESIHQTMSRTLLTSLTTWFVVAALWLMGGIALDDFAFTLVVGVIAGTYSTIFIASPTVVALEYFIAGREAAKTKKAKAAEAASA